MKLINSIFNTGCSRSKPSSQFLRKYSRTIATTRTFIGNESTIPSLFSKSIEFSIVSIEFTTSVVWSSCWRSQRWTKYDGCGKYAALVNAMGIKIRSEHSYLASNTDYIENGCSGEHGPSHVFKRQQRSQPNNDTRFKMIFFCLMNAHWL